MSARVTAQPIMAAIITAITGRIITLMGCTEFMDMAGMIAAMAMADMTTATAATAFTVGNQLECMAGHMVAYTPAGRQGRMADRQAAWAAAMAEQNNWCALVDSNHRPQD